MSPEERRYTLLARIWILGLTLIVGAANLVGQSVVSLGILVGGLASFVVVFDRRRRWWAPEVRASTSFQRGPAANRRESLLFAGVLVVVTNVTAAVVLTWR